MHLQVVLLLKNVIAFGARIDLSLSGSLLTFVRLLEMFVQVAATSKRFVAIVVSADERFLVGKTIDFRVKMINRLLIDDKTEYSDAFFTLYSLCNLTNTYLSFVFPYVTFEVPVDEEVSTTIIEWTVLLAIRQVFLLVNISDLLAVRSVDLFLLQF